MNITNLKIDMEFASKIPPLTGEELMRLHESILTEGRCISPIVVWDGVIVDGHNRYRFLSRHPEIEYEVYEKDFADRNDAIAWICKNQLGRRNLTPEQKKYLIGKQYEAEKQALGGDRKSEAAKSMYQNETLIEGENTGERIARENNVSRISVIRAEKYANAVDLAEEAVPGIKDEILSGAIHATDTEIIKIAQAAPDKRPAIVEKLRQPKQPKPKSDRPKGITFNKKYYENPEDLVPSSRPDKEPPISAVLVELGAVVDDFIFPNTQPAIIEEQVFERVQELRANKCRPTKTGRQGLFSGLLYCADCGEKLYFCTTNSFSPKQEHYVCSNYKSNTGTCSAHFIREETLKLFVRQRIFDVTAMFFDDIQGFQNMVYQQRFEEAEKAVKQKKKELEQARKRIADLDRIFKRIYEDDISGTISHERFLKLSAEYEAEQRDLTEFVHTEQTAVDTYEQDRTDFDSFAAVIRKYVGIRELTPAIVNEFVKKIIVHAPDKSTGHRRQRIGIVWNFIGELEQDEDKQIIERQRKSETA